MGTVESGVCSASWYIMVLQKQKTYLIVLISLGMVHHVSAYGECSAGTGKSAGVCEWIGWAAKGREKNCGWNGRSSTCITCAGKTQSECSGLAPACEYVSNKCQGKHTVRINGDKCNGYYSSLFKLTDQDGIERTFDRCVWKRVQYNGEWKICQWRGGFCQHPDYGTTSPTPAPTTTTKTCTCTNGQKVNTCTKNGEECKSCDAGHFLRASDKTCVKCDAGTFQGAATYEGASCSQCATAFFSTAPGATSCTQCPAGTKGITGTGHSTQAGACSSCASGSFQGQPGQSTCTQCPAGTKGNTGTGYATQATACSNCEIGTFQSQQGELTCEQCPAEEHQDAEGKDHCKANHRQCNAAEVETTAPTASLNRVCTNPSDDAALNTPQKKTAACNAVLAHYQDRLACGGSEQKCMSASLKSSDDRKECRRVKAIYRGAKCPCPTASAAAAASR